MTAVATTLSVVCLFGSFYLMVTTRNIAWSMVLVVPIFLSGLLFGAVPGAVTAFVLLVVAGLVDSALGIEILSSVWDYLVAGFAVSLVGGSIGLVSALSFERGRLLEELQTVLEMTRQAEDTIRTSENRYRKMFENTAVSLWEEDITELRAALKALRAQGVHNFKQYLQEHPDFIVSAIRMIKVLDVNEATLTLYEAKTKGDLLGSLAGTLDLDDPIVLRSFQDALVVIAKGEHYYRGESTAKTLTGKRLNVVVSAYISAENEWPSSMLVNVMDITEQEKNEATLRYERNLLRTLIDNLPIAVYVKDACYRKLVANPVDMRWMKEFISDGDVLGKTDLEIFPPEVAAQFFKDDQTVIQTGKPLINREEFYDDKKGRKAWALTSKIPLFNETGEVVGLVGTGIDITERKFAEEALRRLNRELRAISSCNQVLLRAVDEKTLLNEICRIICDIAGYRFAWVGYAEHDDAKTIRPVAWAGFEKGYIADAKPNWSEDNERGRGPAGIAIRYGETVFVQDFATDARMAPWRESALQRGFHSGIALPLKGEHAKVFGVLLISSGEPNVITSEEVRLMEELAGDLAFGIVTLRSRAQRTQVENELKQSELRKQRLELELIQAQKFESLGTLASGVAHDFNNILGIILGYVSLLQLGPADPERVSMSLDAIHKATQRGASLVKQLLTFARKSEPVFESLSVNRIINEVANLLHETIPKAIVISTDLKPDLPTIRADATQIHQVLLNLCLNARDAMPAGGNLSIRSTTFENQAVASQFPSASAREYVVVSVGDTGTGMDEETKQKIFDPFFTTKGPGKGTGLGLALARSIVEVHHGIIDVKTAPTKGTTFTIYFPVEEKTPDSFEDSTSQIADIAGGTETILLIEDEEMLREMAKAALLAKGYNVLTARDGEEGLEMFHRHCNRIALVFTDLGLPKIAGDEVSRHIKKVNAKLPVIIASGFIDATLKSELLGTVFNEIIQKPYSAFELLRAIRTTIDKAK